MASRGQRDAWTEFVRRRTVELRGRILELVRRLWDPARRGLSALPGVVPAKYLVILQCIATGLALVTGSLSVAVILVGAFPHWFEGRRLPLHNIRGVVPGQDEVFICSSTAGRVYKFDLNGGLVEWYQGSGRPMSISRRDDAIVVSGRRPIEEAAFHPGDPARAALAAVEHTWWGHPILVVSRPEGTVRVELQPWYFTLVQTPWPGLVWWALLVVFAMVAGLAHECRRR
jgi:hypothetical protein